MTRRSIIVVSVVALVTTASFISQAVAREYAGRSDTDWVYASKRDCCNGAIALAQQVSATACRDSPAPG